jgi:hypothetical protein
MMAEQIGLTYHHQMHKVHYGDVISKIRILDWLSAEVAVVLNCIIAQRMVEALGLYFKEMSRKAECAM